MDEATIAAFSFPHWAVTADQQNNLLHIATVLAVLSAIYALWLTRRERDPYPLFMFLGAGLAVFYEPLGDILTKVAYPPLDQISLMTVFGRPVPLWMAPNYFFFFCVPVLLLLQFVVRPDVSARKWFLTYAGLVVFVALFEQPGINGDQWRYYAANQAISFNTYPVWVGFANAETLVMMATGVSLLRRTIITARLSFLFVILVPMLLVASHVAPTLFVVSAVYSTDNPFIVNLAALLSIVCCLVNVGLGFLLIRGSWPNAAQRA